VSTSLYWSIYPFNIIFTVDATITFNDGLIVSWGGQPIGVMRLDPVSIVGDVGATLNVQTTFEVANTDYLANFTKVGQYVLRYIFPPQNL